MQNLNTLGYRDAINKKRGLSPKHVRLALDEMAKYHALGYAWMRNYPGGVEQALKDEEVRNNSHLMLTLGQPQADHSGCYCGCVDIKAKAVFYYNDFAQKLNFYFDDSQHNLRNNLNGNHVHK